MAAKDPRVAESSVAEEMQYQSAYMQRAEQAEQVGDRVTCSVPCCNGTAKVVWCRQGARGVRAMDNSTHSTSLLRKLRSWGPTTQEAVDSGEIGA